jgi:hypothetical protein
MPNWCECDLYISGPAGDVEALRDLCGFDRDEPTFDFNAILPYPEVFAVRDAEREACGWMTDKRDPEKMAAFVAKYGNEHDGYNSGGIEWCQENWGTKWPPSQVVVGPRCVSFQTPWCPPMAILERLAALFPNVMISVEYFERGREYCGGATFNDENYEEEYDDGTPETARTKQWQLEGYRGIRGG